jgi:hypothetical protein
VAPRLTALLLIGFTLAASLISHSYWIFPAEAQPAQQNLFFKNLAIIGVLLFYFASGAGAFSLPGLLRSRTGQDDESAGRSARTGAVKEVSLTGPVPIPLRIGPRALHFRSDSFGMRSPPVPQGPLSIERWGNRNRRRTALIR